MPEKEKLYNEIIRVIKNSNVEIGLARAVLSEVDSAIGMVLGRMRVEEIGDRLKER